MVGGDGTIFQFDHIFVLDDWAVGVANHRTADNGRGREQR
jgi:hypothetical protein